MSETLEVICGEIYNSVLAEQEEKKRLDKMEPQWWQVGRASKIRAKVKIKTFYLKQRYFYLGHD